MSPTVFSSDVTSEFFASFFGVLLCVLSLIFGVVLFFSIFSEEDIGSFCSAFIFSNFNPTVLFGLLSAVAIFVSAALALRLIPIFLESK